MRKIAVFGAVFAVIALAVCLVSCSSPSAVISFSVNGEIVHSQVVTETSGLDDFTPSLTNGTFLGWFTDEACTIPFSFHEYILSGEFKDITVYALISHDNTGSGHPDTEEESLRTRLTAPCRQIFHLLRTRQSRVLVLLSLRAIFRRRNLQDLHKPILGPSRSRDNLCPCKGGDLYRGRKP